MGTKNLTRRDLVKASTIALGAAMTVGLFSIPDRPLEWQLPDLSQLKPGDSINLRSTLPLRYRVFRIGSFSVDPSGAPLPDGITLNKNGLLSVEANAPTTAVTGVVFNFDYDRA